MCPLNVVKGMKFKMKNIKELKVLLCSVMIIALGIIFSPRVNALEIAEPVYGDYARENADPNDLNSSSTNGTIYTDKYLAEIEEAYSRVKNVVNSNCKTRGGVCWMNRTLSVNTYKQEKNYYCGPANIKQVIQYINDSSLSQSTYANRMGTNSDSGTLVYKMRNELNYRQSYSDYVYQQMKSDSYDTFITIVKGNIFYGDDTEVKGIPVILHAKTGSLFLYNGTNFGHYLTVSGYNQLLSKITYVDPWSGNYGNGQTLGQHTDTDLNVFNTVSNSRYVIY